MDFRKKYLKYKKKYLKLKNITTLKGGAAAPSAAAPYIAARKPEIMFEKIIKNFSGFRVYVNEVKMYGENQIEIEKIIKYNNAVNLDEALKISGENPNDLRTFFIKTNERITAHNKTKKSGEILQLDIEDTISFFKSRKITSLYSFSVPNEYTLIEYLLSYVQFYPNIENDFISELIKNTLTDKIKEKYPNNFKSPRRSHIRVYRDIFKDQFLNFINEFLKKELPILDGKIKKIFEAYEEYFKRIFERESHPELKLYVWFLHIFKFNTYITLGNRSYFYYFDENPYTVDKGYENVNTKLPAGESKLFIKNLADKNIFSSALSTLRESLIVIKSKESSNKTLSRHYNKQKENVNSSIQKISNEQLTQLETSQKELQIVQLNRIMKAIEEHLNSQGWLPLGTTPFVEQISNLNEEYKQNRMWALLHVETSFSSFKNNYPVYERVLNNIKMNYKTAFIIACLNLKNL